MARVVAGKPATLTQAERREAVRRLARESVSDAAIARLVGCSTSTIFYDRQTLGIESRWVA